ncbi:MAG: hypothetical protein ABMA64_37480 [Myxococcota bacterium]
MASVRCTTVVLGAVSLFGGCNCNSEQDFGFPEPVDPVVVDPPSSFGSWLSFDRSPEGLRPTMSYYDKDRGAVGYAVGVLNDDHTVNWAHERVAGYPDDAGLDVADVGRYSAQKTAPDGTVWLAYQNSSTGALQVSQRMGPSDWSEPVVVDGGTSQPGVGHWASLALDTAGRPVVAHVDAANAGVRVSRYDGTGWTTAQVYAGVAVDQTDYAGVVTTLPAQVAFTTVVSDGDELLVAFQDVAKGQLHLLRGSGTTFADEVVDAGAPGSGVGAWPSMRVEGDEVWIAYQDVEHEGLKFAAHTSAGWALTEVDSAELHGADTALFVRDGEPSIVYFDGMNNDTWLASRTGGGWVTAKLGGDEGAVGYHNEVVEVGGVVLAGSYDYTADTLYVTAVEPLAAR